MLNLSHQLQLLLLSMLLQTQGTSVPVLGGTSYSRSCCCSSCSSQPSLLACAIVDDHSVAALLCMCLAALPTLPQLSSLSDVLCCSCCRSCCCSNCCSNPSLLACRVADDHATDRDRFRPLLLLLSSASAASAALIAMISAAAAATSASVCCLASVISCSSCACLAVRTSSSFLRAVQTSEHVSAYHTLH